MISFIITIIAAVFINIMNIIFIVKDRLYKDENTRLFFFGYFFLLISLLLNLLFFSCFNSPDLYMYSLLFLHSPFTIVLFIFAYTLTRQFNKEHKDLKELMENLEKKVNERTKQLKKANNQKTRFFINLAHEIKTPLTLISNYLNEYSKAKGDGYESEIIKNNLEKLKRDMVNFLDFEKLQSGQVFYNHDHVSHFSEILKTQILLFTEFTLRKRIKVAAEIGENIYIKIDPAALERVINNLLDNAVKYNYPDGHITVCLKEINSTVHFSVADTGPGISLHQQKQIFNPFIQLSHQKRNAEYTGDRNGIEYCKKNNR